MKHLIILILFISLISVYSPACADTIYCPYCGKKADTSYSFCPSCGKSLDGIRNEGIEENSSWTDYDSRIVPGFRHTFSELKNIINQLYSNPKEYVGRTATNFPIKFSVNLHMKDGITSMGLPNRRTRYDENVWYEWRYDIIQDRFLKEDEDFDSPVKIYYQYYPNVPNATWMNAIVILMDDMGEVSQFGVSYLPDYPELEESFLISNKSGTRIVDLYYYHGFITY